MAVSFLALFALSARNDGAGRSYVVARRPLAIGTTLAAADLATQRLTLGEAVGQRAFGRPADVVGATLVAPLAAGELVQASAVSRAGGTSTGRQMSFALEPERLGKVAGGEQVDIVATYGTGADAYTAEVVRAVRVLSVDHGRQGLSDGPTVLTVGLASAEDAVALAHATTTGKVSVVRSTGVPPGPAVGAYRPGAGGGRDGR